MCSELMRLGRTGPDIDCEVNFERDERQAAHTVAREQISKQPQSLNTMKRLVASFGAFLRCAGDGEPDAKISGLVYNA